LLVFIIFLLFLHLFCVTITAAKIEKKIIQNSKINKKMKKNFSLRDKLLKYCELHNMKKNEFHIRAGLSNGFLDKNSGITTDSLAKILKAFPDIDVTWLLIGDELIQPSNVKSGDFSNNSAGGDIIANGSSKEIGEEFTSAVSELAQANLINARTIGEQTDQIGKLIDYITNK
jgi:hypothetical protein